MTVYTLGVWRTAPDAADGFVAAWQDMAAATRHAFPEASAVLLRDRAEPGTFISFGPWESAEQVERWRGSAAFQEGLVALRPHLSGFEPHAMDVVLTVP